MGTLDLVDPCEKSILFVGILFLLLISKVHLRVDLVIHGQLVMKGGKLPHNWIYKV